MYVLELKILDGEGAYWILLIFCSEEICQQTHKG